MYDNYFGNEPEHSVRFFEAVTTHIFWYLLTSIVLCFIIIHLCLIIRSVKLIYGRRVAPDGQLAIIITGASSGFGLATTKRLYKLGFTIFGCYNNDQELGYTELMGIKTSQTASNRLFLIKMDVRSNKSIEHSSQAIIQLLNDHNLKLHCLLNNAGINALGAFELATRESIRNTIDTNLTGLMSVTREFTLRIIKDNGRVVNVSSGTYQFPGKGLAIYGATKSAVTYFSDALNADLESYGASCHVIVPGNSIVKTNILYSRMKHLQSCLSQLSGDQLETYHKMVRLSNYLLKYLFILKMGNGSSSSQASDQKKIANIYGLDLADLQDFAQLREDFKEFQSASLLFRIKQFFVGLLDGSSCDELDNCYTCQGFEDAVRLIKAPGRIYAGNLLYSHISGPIIQCLSPIVCHLLSNLIAKSVTMPR